MEIGDGSLSTRYKQVSDIVKPKTRRMAGHAAQQHVLLECLGIIPCNPQFLITDSVQQFGNSLLLKTSLISSDSSAAVACHINITRSSDSKAVELPIIGFRNATYHHYDAEVGGPLKGPLNTKTSSPKKLRTVSVLSQISHLVSLQNKTVEGPATSYHSHHVAKERAEESAPISAAASSNRALPTTSRVGRKQSTSRRQADGAHDTGTDTLGWIMSPHEYDGRALELQNVEVVGGTLEARRTGWRVGYRLQPWAHLRFTVRVGSVFSLCFWMSFSPRNSRTENGGPTCLWLRFVSQVWRCSHTFVCAAQWNRGNSALRGREHSTSNFAEELFFCQCVSLSLDIDQNAQVNLSVAECETLVTVDILSEL